MKFKPGTEKQSTNDDPGDQRSRAIATWIPIGAGFGVSLGLILHNLALGIAIGTAIGVVMGAAMAHKHEEISLAGSEENKVGLLVAAGMGLLALIIGVAIFAVIALR